MIARRIVISGGVHGVGFRESLVAVATREHVAGWVRNVRDGTVEAFVQGESDAVERVVAWCRHGPPAARVTQLEVTSREADDSISGFDRRPTV